MSKPYSYDPAEDGNEEPTRNRPQIERPQGNTYKRPDKPAQRKSTAVSFNGLHRRRNKRVSW